MVSPKKYSSLTNDQAIAFCFIIYIYLDSKHLLSDVYYDTSTTQFQQKLLKIHQLKDKLSFHERQNLGNLG